MFMDNCNGEKETRRKIVVAICYDFDRTLSPDEMQAQGFIQDIGFEPREFWETSNRLAEENDMDQTLAWMLKMKEDAHGRDLFTRESLIRRGEKITFFPGVESWFERINTYGSQYGICVEHYVISSGLREMIEGTYLARQGVFKKIYASSFYYDKKGVALWPAQVVNFTNKTQYLFRIEKGVLDINDPGVNSYKAPQDIRVPFCNMIYIGDSETDIPCMSLVNKNGGFSVGVYDGKNGLKHSVYKMLREHRIGYFVPADYREGGGLDLLIKDAIDKVAAVAKLDSHHKQCVDEVSNYDLQTSEDTQRKNDLIIALEASCNFATTHKIIGDLSSIAFWTEDEKILLCEAAVKNSQVRYILSDADVRAFYNSLDLGKSRSDSEAVMFVQNSIKSY